MICELFSFHPCLRKASKQQQQKQQQQQQQRQQQQQMYASPVVITIKVFTLVTAILSLIQGCWKQDVWYSVPRPNPGHSEKVRRALRLPSILLYYTLNGRG